MIKGKLTIKKLKELIDKLPDDMPVIVDGHERGLEQCKNTAITNIFTYENNCGVYGEFINEQDQFFDLETKRNKTEAKGQGFYLSRYKKEDW
jgi:hypothetical protein